MIQKLLTVKFSKITVSKGCLHAQTVYNVHMLNTTTHSLIAAAIAPMRDAAIARAESMMTKRIDWVLAKLEADGGDANINFAYPHSRMSRSDYRAKESAYNFVGRITTGAARGANLFGMNAPRFRERCEDGIARVMEEVRSMAAQSFDAYVAKLTVKIGDGITSATTHQNNVWFDSDLIVTRIDGTVETWNTKMITNYSVYGLAFNQFPTRKVKR